MVTHFLDDGLQNTCIMILPWQRYIVSGKANNLKMRQTGPLL